MGGEAAGELAGQGVMRGQGPRDFSGSAFAGLRFARLVSGDRVEAPEKSRARANAVSEPRDRSEPAKRLASERVRESGGAKPLGTPPAARSRGFASLAPSAGTGSKRRRRVGRERTQ